MDTPLAIAACERKDFTSFYLYFIELHKLITLFCIEGLKCTYYNIQLLFLLFLLVLFLNILFLLKFCDIYQEHLCIGMFLLLNVHSFYFLYNLLFLLSHIFLRQLIDDNTYLSFYILIFIYRIRDQMFILYIYMYNSG